VTYAPGIAPAAITNLLTRFATDPAGIKRGVSVEVFADQSLSGEPQSRRVESQFATSGGGLNESLSVFDWLSREEAGSLIGGIINTRPERTFERWTGWYTPTQAGSHTLAIHSSSRYRLFVDDKLVIDTTRVAKAALLHFKQDLSATPHKIVF